jgi:hypothetical protein
MRDGKYALKTVGVFSEEWRSPYSYRFKKWNGLLETFTFCLDYLVCNVFERFIDVL